MSERERIARIVDPELDHHIANQALAKCRALVASAYDKADAILARPEPSEAVVEAVARAICKPVYRTAHPLWSDEIIDQYVEMNWRNHIDQARAAIAAYEAERK